MEKEIVDILTSGKVPILPIDTFVKKESIEDGDHQEANDNKEKEKIRKLKRKQFFRRQYLKKKQEKEKLIAKTPVFDYVSGIWWKYWYNTIGSIYQFLFEKKS